MQAGNEVQISIYRLTGILYSGNDGTMYYHKGIPPKIKSIYIRKGRSGWCTPNLKIERGYL